MGRHNKYKHVGPITNQAKKLLPERGSLEHHRTYDRVLVYLAVLRLPMTPYPLESYWPFHEDPITEALQYKKTYQTGSIHDSNLCFPLTPSDDHEDVIYIPSQYKNGIRLLNAKISLMQQGARILAEPVPPMVLLSSFQSLGIALDSISRNIIFCIRIRDMFISRLNQAYGNAQRKEISKRYRCPIMDAWLYCEYYCGRHDPAGVKAALPEETVWRLGAQGILGMPCDATLAHVPLSFLDRVLESLG